MEDPGDGMADLEAAISDTWSLARANARTRANDIAELDQLVAVDFR